MLINYSFFALAWKAPQEANSDHRENLHRIYTKDLQLLLPCLLPRFHQITRKCLGLIGEILSLPMVFLHCNFGTCNIMADGTSCHLPGIIDLAKAEICPFCQNLHSLQAFTGTLHLKNGWTRYEGYKARRTPFRVYFKTKWETYPQ